MKTAEISAVFDFNPVFRLVSQINKFNCKMQQIDCKVKINRLTANSKASPGFSYF
jgi:hypothetical protein